MVHGPACGWVQQMGIALAIDLHVALVVTRGGQAPVHEGDDGDQSVLAWVADAHLPGTGVALGASGVDVAAEVDERRVVTRLGEQVGHAVYGVLFAKTTQVDFHARSGQQDLTAAPVHLVPTYKGQELRNGLLRGQGLQLEVPGLPEHAGREVKDALVLGMQAVRKLDECGSFGVALVRGLACLGVDLGDDAVGAIAGVFVLYAQHFGLNLVEDALGVLVVCDVQLDLASAGHGGEAQLLHGSATGFVAEGALFNQVPRQASQHDGDQPSGQQVFTHGLLRVKVDQGLLHGEGIDVDAVRIVIVCELGQPSPAGQTKAQGDEGQDKPAAEYEEVGRCGQTHPQKGECPHTAEVEESGDLVAVKGRTNHEVGAANDDLAHIGSVNDQHVRAGSGPGDAQCDQGQGQKNPSPTGYLEQAQYGYNQIHEVFNRQAPQGAIDGMGHFVGGKDTGQLVGDVEPDVVQIAPGDGALEISTQVERGQARAKHQYAEQGTNCESRKDTQSTFGKEAQEVRIVRPALHDEVATDGEKDPHTQGPQGHHAQEQWLVLAQKNERVPVKHHEGGEPTQGRQVIGLCGLGVHGLILKSRELHPLPCFAREGWKQLADLGLTHRV